MCSLLPKQTENELDMNLLLALLFFNDLPEELKRPLMEQVLGDPSIPFHMKLMFLHKPWENERVVLKKREIVF